MVKSEPDVKSKVETKSDVKSNKEHQDSNTCDKCPQVLRQPTNHFLGFIQAYII